MPDNGLQSSCLPIRTAASGADMAQIMWGAGLQGDFAAWYIATQDYF